ncbi:MAG: PEGA domain-containing protein [Candidatus Marinimicrobia bacterium]|jgi:hypothetical protein|nr:PEGA domain-containing protein [Candidatus Neomarinimicrobiota bacterium]MBT3936068.1 PEGA domain-containing protein [Candidatus Neomarinimicrobiota bacterium]MBT3960437.1 PEGA domain-containing protein [Candidatus Neomarinimicrobiota bacterium]MBT4383765.1 PEGA domain-containing protein [Candidatus Neomarinimicrobiota bacterium]MBT4636209.1 PEGA domain-containing protein [Candidatus Neomarinimicrobiota bacterium]
MKIIMILTAMTMSLTLNGCATSLTHSISINSEPEGAIVIVDGNEVGETPTSINLNRSDLSNKDVILKLEGYEGQIFSLQKDQKEYFVHLEPKSE